MGLRMPQAECSRFSRGSAALLLLGSIPLLMGLSSWWWHVIERNRCGASSRVGVSSDVSRAGVELGHELAVGGSRGGQFLVAFLELQP